MKWFAENKFLAVFLAIVLLGAAALGFLLMQAHSSYGAISSQYDEKARELQRLQSLEPYPNAANLKATTEVRDSYKAQIDGLFARMAALSLPAKSDVTPNAFQDELRASVSAVTAKAASDSVEIKEPFYLGFDAYQNTLPPAAAAVPLSRDLAVLKMLVDRLIELRVVSINSIKRVQLPEEVGVVSASPATAQGKGQPGDDKALKVSITKDLVNISFVAKPAAFKQIMNDLAESKQFLVVRTLLVNNSDPTGPSRDLGQFTFDPAATAEPGADPSADAAATGGNTSQPTVPGAVGAPGENGAAAGDTAEGRKKLVFGGENVGVELLIEVLSFTSNSLPAAGATPAATN